MATELAKMTLITRRDMLATMASVTASAALNGHAMSRPGADGVAQAPHAKNRMPNVIIIIVDDQAHGDLSCTGNSALNTPNIDHLAETGVRFSNHYGCPLCSPARASLLT